MSTVRCVDVIFTNRCDCEMSNFFLGRCLVSQCERKPFVLLLSHVDHSVRNFGHRQSSRAALKYFN